MKNVCPGCQRSEIHKFCPAFGTPLYMTGILFTKEHEKIYARIRRRILSQKTAEPEIVHENTEPDKYSLSQEWKNIFSHINDIDPNSHYVWEGILVGYLIGKGVKIETVKEWIKNEEMFPS